MDWLILSLFCINGLLSAFMFTDEFTSYSCPLFRRWPVVFLLLALTACANVTILWQNMNAGLGRGQFGVVLPMLTMVGAAILYLPFLFFGSKNVLVNIYSVFSHLYAGPKKLMSIEKLIEQENYGGALADLNYYETRYPNNQYIQ
ncbi:MAG: hypothetical protein HQL32_16850, partial [Planctomycetes bacterium]|nr:hypothetical protein [Planctomycetota bacterium]